MIKKNGVCWVGLLNIKTYKNLAEITYSRKKKLLKQKFTKDKLPKSTWAKK